MIYENITKEFKDFANNEKVLNYLNKDNLILWLNDNIIYIDGKLPRYMEKELKRFANENRLKLWWDL